MGAPKGPFRWKHRHSLKNARNCPTPAVRVSLLKDASSNVHLVDAKQLVKKAGLSNPPHTSLGQESKAAGMFPDCGPGRCLLPGCGLGPGHRTCAAGTQWSCLQTRRASPQVCPAPVPGLALPPCDAAYRDWAPGRGSWGAAVLPALGVSDGETGISSPLPSWTQEAARDGGLSASLLTSRLCDQQGEVTFLGLTLLMWSDPYSTTITT